ncbi:Alkaline phosphatase D [Cyphellophora attinorum]|uniref:Alkaline phosphatase D n=1 Tax=Cyphellophora attinorum TaxID=1664694 RepID=A0A0N0NI40_9EURO|nr:Alkaline phosphatase D [Phialophora attinorum]KPI35401.1 Alkaline phosphatase D [Phialophora attinorum]
MALAPAEWVAAVSSTLARLCTFCFLRWIPGHHFPPLILTSVAVYLATTFTQSRTFGRPLTLKEAFPRVLGNGKHEKEKPHDEHEPAIYHDEKEVFKTVVWGIPNWREPELSYVSIGINILMALLCLDLVFRGPLLHPVNNLRFSRVGFVDNTSAKVVFREPDPANLPVYAYIKGLDEAKWTATDRIYYIDSDTDYTYPLSFTNLRPDTTYTYSLSNDLSGTFTTAPAPHSPSANSLVFLTSSCIKANFPYRPFSHSLAIHGFEHLSNVLRSLPSPAAFMLFLGDFVYIDVPLRLSSSIAHYRAEYRRAYASPSWKLPLVSPLPWLHTLDDHEIANDWSSGNETEPFPAASDPFIHYHVSVNPPTPPTSLLNYNPPSGENTTYFQFTRGPAQFFMLDTRRYRTDPEPNISSGSHSSPGTNPPPSPDAHSMLGPEQLASLLAFISSTPPAGVHWKIIASSVPFTKNWRFGTSDTWGGFPTERALILRAMHSAERSLPIRVVILSGDRHEFAAIRFPPPVATEEVVVDTGADLTGDEGVELKKEEVLYSAAPQAGPHEFSVGPLSMFYLPFRTFRQVDGEDVAIRYVPDGNSKVGVVDIQNLGAGPGSRGRAAHGDDNGSQQRSMLKYTLWVDGEVSWEYVLTSPSPHYRGKGLLGRGGFGLW